MRTQQSKAAKILGITLTQEYLVESGVMGIGITQIESTLYPSELKIWSPGSVKALGIVDRKVVHISNIDHFTIGDSQELSRSLATKF